MAGWQKPYRGTQLNRSHFYAGLFDWMYIFNEGTGGIVNDATGKLGSGTISGADWLHGGIDFNTAGDKVTLPASGVEQTDTSWSSILRVFIRTSGTGTIYGRMLDDSNNGIIALNNYGLTVAAEDRVLFNGVDVGFSADNWYTIGIRSTGIYGSTDRTQGTNAYVDGVFKAQSQYCRDFDTGNAFCVGDRAAGDRTFDGTIEYVFFSNRCIPEAVIQSIGSNPYASYQRRKRFFIPAPTKGLWDIDRHDSIGESGLAGDGTWNILPNASEEATITMDTTRIAPAVRISDGDLRVGGSSIIVGRWLFNDNTTGTVIAADIGTNGVLEDGTNTSDVSSTDGKRGRAIEISTSGEWMSFNNTIDDLADPDQFTVIITWKPTHDKDAATSYLFTVGFGADDRIYMVWSASGFYQIGNDIGNANTTYSFDTTWQDFDTGGEIEQYWTFMLSVDLVNDLIACTLNGDVLSTHVFTGDWTDTGAIDQFLVGSVNNSSCAYDALISELMLLNGCVLTYGGALHNLSQYSDGSAADDAILFHWPGNDCTSTPVTIGNLTGTLDSANTGGTTSFPTTGGPYNLQHFDNESAADNHTIQFTLTSGTHFSKTEGTISFWFMTPTAPGSSDGIFELAIDGSNRVLMLCSGGTSYNAYMYATGGNATAWGVTEGVSTGVWRFMEISYSFTTGVLSTRCNRIDYDQDRSFAGSWDAAGTSATLIVGSIDVTYNCTDMLIADFTVTDKYDRNIGHGWSQMGNPLDSTLTQVT